MTAEKFQEEFYYLVTRLLELAQKARTEGILAIEEEYDKNLAIQERDLYHNGLRMVVDGIDADTVSKWFNFAIESGNRRDDYYELILASVIKEGMLSIQRGDNPRIIAMMLEARCPKSLRTKNIISILEGAF
jgi:flagellar motor component MotA